MNLSFNSLSLFSTWDNFRVHALHIWSVKRVVSVMFISFSNNRQWDVFTSVVNNLSL